VNYPVDVVSLHENFPTHFEVPNLLLEFADWLKEQKERSVGNFDFQSDRFNDFWIENGADLHEHFAFFLRDPTGGQIGYWLYDGSKPFPPIVNVGSEGQLDILGDSLEEFLARLAEGTTNAADLDSRDEKDNQGSALANWITSRSVKHTLTNQPERPDLREWMDKWGQEQRALIDGDSWHIQIADKLRKFVKPNAQPWETANFDVLLVGTQFRMWHRSFGPKPMPKSDVADLESLFRAVREQRARKFPERGLWFTAWVKIGTQGGASLSCNFMDVPRIMDEQPAIPNSDYDIDLRDFPRSKHWTPKWL